MKFSKLVEHVSKKPIPPHTKSFVTEVMVMDEEGEDVEVGTSSTLYTDKADNCRTYQQVPFILISI